MKNIVRLAAAAGLGLAGTLAVAAPALAAPAPSCVRVAVFNNDPTDLTNTRVALTNNCSTAKRLRVIFHAGADSRCQAMNPGDVSQFISLSVFGTYDKTVTC